MTDGLDYIRQEVAKFGKKARVPVIRWDAWSKIRPLGQEPMKQAGITEGSLEDPILRSKLKDALRAEIEAELKAGLTSLDAEEAPKKRKKKIEVSDEPEAPVQEEKSWVDPTISNDPYLA